MESMAPDLDPSPVATPAPPRWRFDGTKFVIALYIALVLGAPVMVRFAPDADALWHAAITAAPRLHCADANAIPSGCASNFAASAYPASGGYRRRLQSSTRSIPPALALAT